VAAGSGESLSVLPADMTCFMTWPAVGSVKYAAALWRPWAPDLIHHTVDSGQALVGPGVITGPSTILHLNLRTPRLRFPKDPPEM
jgi:hypothetical protein